MRIARRAADRLRAGHLWVYRSDLVSEGDVAGLEPGALADVADPGGKLLGTALYSSASQIMLRLVSPQAGLDRPAYLEAMRARVREAFLRRRAVAPLHREPGEETSAQRLLFSEADAVPGIVADRYNNLVIVQLLIQGTAQDDVRSVLAEALQDELSPHGEPCTLWERPDPNWNSSPRRRQPHGCT